MKTKIFLCGLLVININMVLAHGFKKSSSELVNKINEYSAFSLNPNFIRVCNDIFGIAVLSSMPTMIKDMLEDLYIFKKHRVSRKGNILFSFYPFFICTSSYFINKYIDKYAAYSVNEKRIKLLTSIENLITSEQNAKLLSFAEEVLNDLKVMMVKRWIFPVSKYDIAIMNEINDKIRERMDELYDSKRDIDGLLSFDEPEFY